MNAASGGVIYSRNPLDIRDDAIRIHSTFGLPKSVVDGAVSTDEFVVRRGETPVLAERHIRDKDQEVVCLPGEGVCLTETTGGRAGEPSITDEQALYLAGAAEKLEAMRMRTSESTVVSTRLAAPLRSASSPDRSTLAISRYQSQNSRQKNA